MISSTVHDLPHHREAARDACLRQGMQPLMMEHVPAGDKQAIEISLEMVDSASIYITIIAFRYGYVPEGHEISLTEMEYRRAGARNIPRLVFIMDPNHPITITDVEEHVADPVQVAARKARLALFTEQVKRDHIVSYFKSPEQLQMLMVDGLSRYREPVPFHYVAHIPQPPEAYVAHPYTLLQTGHLIGRHFELDLLTDWVSGTANTEVAAARVLTVVALGGMGKSALTWAWFAEMAPQEMRNLRGRIWWSFYESDAEFANFVVRSLAYLSGEPIDEIERRSAPEREDVLLQYLDREPYLIVMDGSERLLTAYARMDAAHMPDSELRDPSPNVRRQLRRTSDPRVGAFLRRLSRCRASRVLISTRLYPADLENSVGKPLDSCFRLDLTGMSDHDAVAMWRAFGVDGSRNVLISLLNSFGNHPLLIQTLVSEIAYYKPAPGDLERWQQDHPEFDPTGIELEDAQRRVLTAALRGVSSLARSALNTLAAFRMPVPYDTLIALLARTSGAHEGDLGQALTEVEDRGLLGWDRRSNRYDLHPLVRSTVWRMLTDETRREVQTRLLAHLRDLVPLRHDQPTTASYEPLKVHPEAIGHPVADRWDDLVLPIEMYYTLVSLRRYDDALSLYIQRLEQPIYFRLGAARRQIELLSPLLPSADEAPRLTSASSQNHLIGALAQSYHLSGQSGHAVSLHTRYNRIQMEHGNSRNLAKGLCNLAEALRYTGRIYAAETALRKAVAILGGEEDPLEEAAANYLLGRTLACRGMHDESLAALESARKTFTHYGKIISVGTTNASLAQRALWFGDFEAAASFADIAWELAHDQSNARDFVRAARLQGAAALRLNDLGKANERLGFALAAARAIVFTLGEIPVLVDLADLRCQQGEISSAKDLLDDVLGLVETGPYPLFHADLCVVTSRLHEIEGDLAGARNAAGRAFRAAWCDGEPYSYYRGVADARARHLHLETETPNLHAFGKERSVDLDLEE
jgi:tetratricopeptide (TPR) repeat protein